MNVALPFDVQNLYDAVFAFLWGVFGFLGAGLVGAIVGVLGAYAYIDVTNRLDHTERVVVRLREENEALNERVETLEAADDEVENASSEVGEFGESGESGEPS
ncbi:hypothetical protein JCM17823_14140 [Halorubrum gandharaense]